MYNMGKISEIFNFENIGGKIKNYAKWSCWITILLIWIAAPILCILLAIDYVELCWIPLVSGLVAPFFVWIGSWTLYAFGEFVEKTSENESNTKQILIKLNEKNTRKHEEKIEYEVKKSTKVPVKEPFAKDIPETQENTMTDMYWICGKCKTKNLNTRTDCWSCGNSK